MASKKERDREFNRDIAFGIEQTAACMASDPIAGPLINDKIQRMIGLPESVKLKAMKGEIIGDTGSLVAFIALQRFFPGVTRGIRNVVKSVAGGFYGMIGRAKLKSWAARHKVAENSPEFAQKVEEYKDIQSNNFARSSVIAAGSIGFNIVAHKHILGNHNSYKTIFVAKLVDATVTLVGILTARLAFPRFFHQADKKIAAHVSAPIVRAAQKIFGTYESKEKAEGKRAGFSAKLMQERQGAAPSEYTR